MSLAARIARIEAAAQVDVGSRGIASFIIPGELAAAASSLASSITSGGLAIFTGFPCVTGHVIPTENDGLAGAVAIARAALALGKPTVHFVTDDVNAAPVRACADWLLSLGRTMGQDWSPSITVNAFPSPSSPPSPSAPSCDALHRLVTSCTHAVAIERTGRAADGRYTNCAASFCSMCARKRDLASSDS